MSSTEGWIKLHRKLQKSELYVGLTSKQRDIFVQLLLMVNHLPAEVNVDGKAVHVCPGQCVTSLPSIKKHCAKDVSIQNIRTCLLILETWQFLTCKSTNKYRIITICKWEEYQGEATDKLTGSQQASNRQLTANKNEKNDKELIHPLPPAGDVEKKLLKFLKTQQTVRNPEGYLLWIKGEYGDKYLSKLLTLEFKSWGEHLDFWKANPTAST